jgi:hypothetical protein
VDRKGGGSFQTYDKQNELLFAPAADTSSLVCFDMTENIPKYFGTTDAE